MKLRSRIRTLITCATLATAAGWWSIHALAIGTGQSYASVAAPFTQDLYGATGNLLDAEFGILGGVAFAPNGDVWSSECYFYGTRLHRFDSHSTVLVNGTLIHPESIVDISDVGPYGQSGALPFGAGGCGLVNHPDGYIYSNSMFGIWKLDASTGLPVDPSSTPPNQPINPNGPAPVGRGLVGGASAQPGNALGIAVDPQVDDAGVHHLIYVGADCHPSLSPASDRCTLWDLNPSTGVTQVFARTSRAPEALVDGLYFDPSGQYIFAAHRDEDEVASQNSLRILRRPATLKPTTAVVDDTQIAQSVLMTSEPDGVAFHAQEGFVVTLNESDDGPVKAGTMTRFDFPSGDYSAAPTQTEFASGGFRGDLLQVGADGCIYATQGQIYARQDFLATRYDDLTTTTENSIVQICGGFAVPPGVDAEAPGSISGTVYIDNNRNAQHDAGEPGIAGVTVTLTGGSGGTGVSGADGTYTFPSLASDSYSVASPATATGLQRFTPSPLSVTLATGENKDGVDFGYVPGSIAGFAYVDLNRNGAKDGGEPGIPGVVITLAGPTNGPTTTAADGSYKFNMLSAGGYTDTAPSTAAGKALATPSPLTFVLAPGEDKTDQNFGYVGGHLTLIKVVVNDNGGTAVATDFTLSAAGPTPVAGAGGVSQDVDAGSYTLSETAKPGYTAGAWTCTGGTQTGNSVALAPGQSATCTITNDDQPAHLIVNKVVVNNNGGSLTAAAFSGTIGGAVVATGGNTWAGASTDRTLTAVGVYSVAESAHPGYDVTFSTGCTGAIALGETKTCTITNDDQPGGLSGFVYVDTNRNSAKDAGEPGISGVTVTGPGAATTTTAGDGSYSFSNLNPGTYSVSSPGTAAGYALETPSPLSRTVTAGQTTANVNFGYIAAAAYMTVTQGGWGAPPSGNNPGMILRTNFAAVYPNGVTIGGSPYYLKFTSSAAIEVFLPAGGKPGVLNKSATNPSSSSANVFAGQVLALQLSVDFSARGITTGGLSVLKIAPGNAMAGNTVAQVLAIANQVLAGNTAALPAGMSVSSLNDLVTLMNQNFDNGTTNAGLMVP